MGKAAEESWTDWAKRQLSRFGTACVLVGRYPAYPAHALFRIGSRLCLLLATVASILSVAMLVASLYCVSLKVSGTETWKATHQFLVNTIGNVGLLQFSTFFVSLGVAGALLKFLGGAAWENAKYLGATLGCASKGDWIPPLKSEGSRFPDLKVIDSLRTTWKKYIVTIPETVRKSFCRSWRLVFVLLGIAAVFAAVWFGQRGPAPPAGKDTHQVIVMGAGEAKPEALRVYLARGSVFSLMHMDNAKLRPPDSGRGICLDGENLTWLCAFRRAVRECIAEPGNEEATCEPGDGPCPPVLKVTGFASIAPEQGDATSTCNTLDKNFNCKVANLRARAVGAFLADEDEAYWQCPQNGTFNGASQCSAELCVGKPIRKTMTATKGSSRSIGVVVRQWASERQMLEGKPVNDGEQPDPRRYRVEVLNRAVHIKVLKDFCTSPVSTA